MALHLLHDYPLGSARGNTCICCGSARRSPEEPLVWLHNSDWEGHVVLCGECVLEAGRLIGMQAAPDVQASAEVLAITEARAANALARAERAEALAEALRTYDVTRVNAAEAVGRALVALPVASSPGKPKARRAK